MKIFIVFASMLLLTEADLFAQNKPKPKEKPPTQTEMEKMMKEAQMEMDKMDPETLRMMDSMGIKRPNFKTVPKVSDKQLATAFEEEGIVIPSKKIKLIALLPKNVMSNTQLTAYIKITGQSIASIIKPEAKQMADKVIEQFKNDKYYGALIASAANGMWVAGYKEAATYLMGKATETLPNADNHNNFAAYLTMMGAAHMAIPVLEKLNTVHRKNSTVLNNLGQAWLQLGDVIKAEKYLDSTIIIYAYHPQANYTKCLILESKGKRAEAAVALKRSLKHSVTKNKLKKLRELEEKEYKPKGYHIPKVYFSASFNLGLYTAIIPKAYSKSAGMEQENQWKGFREQLSEEKNRIDAAITVVNRIVEDDINKMSAKIKKHGVIIFPPYYEKATERLNSYMQGREINFAREVEAGVDYLQEWARLKGDFEKELTTEQERYEMKTPNGQNLAANCAGEMPVITKYITAINDLNQKHNQKTVKRLVTEAYQFYQYSTDVAITDAAALKMVLEIKSDFLRRLIELKHEYYGNLTECIKEKKEAVYKKGELPDYDEVNCQILNSISFPGMGSIIMRCNNMSMYLNPILSPVKGSITANFDGYIEQASIGVTVKAVDIEVGGVFDKDGNFVKGNVTVSTEIKGIKVSATGEADANGFTKGSLELGIGTELSFLPEGLEGESPVEISLKNELGLTMELGKEGITDMYVKDKITGDVAANIEVDNTIELTQGEISNTGEVTNPETMKLPVPKSPSISVSADNRWSVNSGHSVTGSLSGLRPN